MGKIHLMVDRRQMMMTFLTSTSTTMMTTSLRNDMTIKINLLFFGPMLKTIGWTASEFQHNYVFFRTSTNDKFSIFVLF